MALLARQYWPVTAPLLSFPTSCTQPSPPVVPGIKFGDREILRHIGFSDVEVSDPLQALSEAGHRTSKTSHVVPCATDRPGDPAIPSSSMPTNLTALCTLIVFSLDSILRRTLDISKDDSSLCGAALACSRAGGSKPSDCNIVDQVPEVRVASGHLVAPNLD